MKDSELQKLYPMVKIGEHIQVINTTTSSQAIEMYNSGIRCKLVHLIYCPALVFLNSFFITQGIFHGIRGIIISVLAGYEEFLTYLKLWEIQNTGKHSIK